MSNASPKLGSERARNRFKRLAPEHVKEFIALKDKLLQSDTLADRRQAAEMLKTAIEYGIGKPTEYKVNENINISSIKVEFVEVGAPTNPLVLNAEKIIDSPKVSELEIIPEVQQLEEMDSDVETIEVGHRDIKEVMMEHLAEVHGH